MPTSLVALSSGAIAAIYLAGYVRTQAADATLADAQAATPVVVSSASSASSASSGVPAAPTPTNAPTVALRPTAPPISSGNLPSTPGARARSAPTTLPRAPAAAQPQTQTQTSSATFKDGTFSGHGTSRRGDVWVDVTVQGGYITAVNITRSTLQYPLRDIAALPDEVVQRQSALVDVVSRATFSSMAFRAAVSQALSQATQA